MNPLSRPRRLSFSLLMAMAAIGGHAVAEPLPPPVPVEVRQETQIWTTFTLNPSLRAHDLKVTVYRGKATLTGKVDEEVNKELARQIALGVNGILEVDNKIVVDPGYVPAARPDGRHFGDWVDDASITAAVKSKLVWSKHADGLSTTVETKAGRVSLKGTADSIAARDLAGRLTANTRGVQSVDNQLVVQAPGKPTLPAAASGSAKEAGHGISDSWITTKVKSTFLYSSHVDGSAITVSTSQGVVALTGKVSSAAERDLAIELARNLRGVKGVDAKALRFSAP